MISIEKLEASISESQRFIKKARAAIARIKGDRYALISGAKESASAKRSSLDLSRSLADLRK